MDIRGSVAIVTGGAGGIGAALAQRLLERGAKVVVTDLDASRVSQTVHQLDIIAPGAVAGLAGDCSNETSIRATIALAEERFGPVDLYAANAGVGVGHGLEATEDDWSLAIDVNLLAHVRAAQILVPMWLERGRGHFLSTASAAGLLTQIGSPTYAVTKHAAVAFAEWLSVTYGDRGVGVSCLCPMGVNTAMLEVGADGDGASGLSTRAVSAAGAVLEPLDVASMVVDGITEERFLILPHAEVLEFFRRKGSDYDRWIGGMRRFRETLV